MSGPKIANKFLVIENEDDIPAFASEREAAEYWDTHTFSDAILDTFVPRPDWFDRIKKTPRDSWVRIDLSIGNRLTRLAEQRNCPRERLVEEFLSERLTQEEQREALSTVGE